MVLGVGVGVIVTASITDPEFVMIFFTGFTNGIAVFYFGVAAVAHLVDLYHSEIDEAVVDEGIIALALSLFASTA